jgi:hypothetical protein
MTTGWATLVGFSGLLAVVFAVANGSEAEARRARAPDPPVGSQRSEPCGPSGERVRAEYEAFLSGRRDCRRDSDCDLATAECPLPVYRAVTTGAKRDVERLAERLVRRAADEGCMCVSDLGVPKVACIKRQCSEVNRY